MMNKTAKGACFCALLVAGGLIAGDLYAQRQLRRHTATTAGELDLQAATHAPITASQVSITIEGDRRVIRSNSISEHDTGRFPNGGNPNGISEQDVEFSIPLQPVMASRPTFYSLGTFGVAVNGVIIEPQAAEWYLGERDGGWQYDPLGGAIALGLDENHAHVQPDGTYHYHGLPTGLLTTLGLDPHQESPLVGWAMDGFPIYARYADDSGSVRELASSYRLKSGSRPSGGDQPGGTYDGTFLEDWEYVAGLGDLDQCNGTTVTTAEFPQGTYAYFLTATYPFIPRCFTGTPIDEALPRGPGGAQQAASVRNSPRPQRGGDPLTQAAAELGVSVDALRRAVGPPPPNFARAAQQLGIDEQQLRRAFQNARR